MRYFLCILAISMFLASPLEASAAPDLLNGLVPACGGRSEPVPADGGGTTVTYTPCDTCHLVQLIKNVIDFIAKYVALFGVALMLMIGGFQMVAGGLGGSASGYQKGIHTIRNAFIGLVIVFISWLAVDTVIKLLVGTNMNSVLSGEPGRIFPVSQVQTGFGPWNAINCTKGESVNVTTKPLPGSALGLTVAQAYGEGCVCRGSSPQEGTGMCAGVGDVCDTVVKRNLIDNANSPEGKSLRASEGTNLCQNGMLKTYGTQIDGSARPSLLAAVLIKESSGRENPPPAGAGAVGIGQLLPSTAKYAIPVLKAELANKSLPEVADWLKVGNNGVRAAALYLDDCTRRNSTLDRALACYHGGQYANAPSVHCNGASTGVARWECPYDSFKSDGKTSCWPTPSSSECTKNTGYAPTRDEYVPVVKAIQERIESGACTPTK